MLEQEFHSRHTHLQREESRLKAQNERFIRLRLWIFVIGAALAGMLYYKKMMLPALVALLVATVLFIIVVVVHQGTKRGLRRCQALIGFYGDFLKRISGEWTSFPDDGAEFLIANHPFSADLNIFGPKSLFQMLNLTHTFKGRQRLSQLLGEPEKSKAAIEERQSAVDELSKKLDFAEELALRGLMHRKSAKNPAAFIQEIKKESRVAPLLHHPALILSLPAVTLLSALLAGRALPGLYFVLLSGLVLQLLLFAWSYKTVFPVLGMVHQYKNELKTYEQLIELIEGESFTSPYLKALKEKLRGECDAAAEIKGLVVLSDYIDFKYSPFLYFFLNVLFLWDLHLFNRLNAWKRRNGEKIDGWLTVLGEYEALMSLAALAMATPVTTYPLIREKGPWFEASGLGHPFIDYKKRVPNEVALKGIDIITGSNMSGKTTLLRTVGINLVLAYAGAPVCATSLSASLMSLFTSMRNTDDLSEGVSTFYAELLRIKEIVSFSKEGQEMLFLIDEIFKGTNSKDRIEGAKMVLRGLNKPWAIGMISTHDYELCDLEREDTQRFANYHFTEGYVNQQIYFDYKLHQGRCRTSNARYLMKMVGLDA